METNLIDMKNQLIQKTEQDLGWKWSQGGKYFQIATNV